MYASKHLYSSTITTVSLADLNSSQRYETLVTAHTDGWPVHSFATFSCHYLWSI